MVDQISVFVENKGGRLSAVMETLYKADVNIRALSIADTSDFGLIRLIVTDTEKAVSALLAADFTVKVTSVICVSIPDKPGSLFNVIGAFSAAGISIEYSYSFMGKHAKQADIALRVDEQHREAAIELLKKNGSQLVTAADIGNV
ncbi:amino acid-binding protein [Clostridia bacterium]|nr:amino acid-binding protein [Clostridia bacterium]